MIRTQVSFDEDLYKRAKQVAKQSGISLAELCRQGILRMLGEPKTEQPWMQYAGMFSLDDSTSSESVDDVVYGREEP